MLPTPRGTAVRRRDLPRHGRRISVLGRRAPRTSSSRRRKKDALLMVEAGPESPRKCRRSPDPPRSEIVLERRRNDDRLHRVSKFQLREQGRIGRSMRREVKVSLSRGRISRLKKPPGRGRSRRRARGSRRSGHEHDVLRVLLDRGGRETRGSFECTVTAPPACLARCPSAK